MGTQAQSKFTALVKETTRTQLPFTVKTKKLAANPKAGGVVPRPLQTVSEISFIIFRIFLPLSVLCFC
jgi:hypothetical protein